MTYLYRCLTAIVFLTLVYACDSAPDVELVKLDAAAEAPPGRLSGIARPTAYYLDLIMDPRLDGFTGSVTIDIQLLQDSNLIWLHGKDLEVSSVQATLADGSTVSGEYTQVLDSGVARLHFSEALPAGAVSVKLEYGALFSRNLTGLFKVEEQGESYVLAKSESIQARRYLPAFDEPGMKASYSMRLTVPVGYQVIGNNPELRREAAGDGMETVIFARSRPMSTYLLSLAVGPFDVVEQAPLPANEFRSHALPLRGFSRKGRGGDMSYILDITPQMVEIFERELERPYPFAKLDIVAAPQWPSGATELSAAITYRESLILVGDNPAPGTRLRLINVHAHELSHMWFGNLVTPPWWDDLWLKEGFATWSEPLVLTIMEPDGGHDVIAATYAIGAMELDSLASTRAIREPIVDNNNIRNAYDLITYFKSLGVIHMVDQYFGSQVFRPALGRYIAKFADTEADSPQFYQLIGEETKTPALTETFRSFVEQQGVPLVSADLQCNDGKQVVKLKQQRYRPLGSMIQADAHRWTIPICLLTPGGERHCVLMDKAEAEIALSLDECPRWLLPNAGGSGYYRWNIPEQQLRALVADFDSFTATEALSILDSLLAAFESGELAPELVWNTIEASSRFPQRQVVTAPLGHLKRYSEHYFTARQKAAMADKMRAWYGPVLAETAASEDPDQQILHTALLEFMALVVKDPEARSTLRRQAEGFTGFQRPAETEALNSDLYESALTVAVQDIGAEFVEHLIEFRSQLDDSRFESASAIALGRVTDLDLLPRIRALVMSDAVGPREKHDLLLSSTATLQTGVANWQWIASNFEQITQQLPGQWLRRTPRFAQEFCSKTAQTQLRELFTTYAELVPGYERALSQTEERLELCMALKDQVLALGEAL